MRKRNLDLTKGSILSQIFIFALPFLGSSLIQQLYGTVDIIFAGQLLGKEAAAAIGASTFIAYVIVGFFIGISVGVSVITAKLYGAGKMDSLRELFTSALSFALALSTVLVIISIAIAQQLLTLLNTPDTIMRIEVLYIRIYLLSLPSIIFYNIVSGIIRAMGDSRSPMMYRLYGGIANVAGNTLFVYFLRLGVAGAAMSTLLCQTVCAVLVIRHLFRYPHEYRPEANLKLNKSYIIEILKVGIPAAIQTIVITISNLIVQSQINTLGVLNIAAFTAYYKVETFIYMPVMAIGQACSIFTGQNYGAGKIDRMMEGLRKINIAGVLIVAVISALIMALRVPVFRLFINDPEVVTIGARMAMISFPFYFLYVLLEDLSGTIRSTGNSLAPMITVVFNMLVLRLIFLKVAMTMNPTATGVVKIYPETWFTTVISLTILFIVWKRKEEQKHE